MKKWLSTGSIRLRGIKYCAVVVLPVAVLCVLLIGLGFHCLGAAAAAGAILCCASLLAILRFSKSITEPLGELSEAVKRVAEGSYGVHAEKKYDDEIGVITESVNEISVQLGRAASMQSEFISSVSHELRTPLTAITGWSETLVYNENLDEDFQRGIGIISKEASRLTKMVEDLLEFTRIQDGRFKLNIQPTDVSAELEELLLAYGELLGREELKLEYEPCDEELPEIDGDPERLKQVFLNILDNAAKYGRSGGKVVVTTGLEEGFIVVKTRDFGIGIPEDELPHVKEKFYKGSSRERGNGIGLSVCDEIVERHGGRLVIENSEGGGVTVSVFLPVRAKM